MKRIIFSIALAIVITLAYIFGWSSLFSVKKISIAVPDSAVSLEIDAQLHQPPSVISLGDRLARVDQRVITARLKALSWIDAVQVNRNFISGEVRISVSVRRPIARLSGSGNQLSFLGENREIFTLDANAVKSATSLGGQDWNSLPLATIPTPSPAVLTDVQLLLQSLNQSGLQILSLTASNQGELTTTILFPSTTNTSNSTSRKKVEIHWGSVQELELKERVMEALLAAPENKKVKVIDLSEPRNPTIR